MTDEQKVKQKWPDAEIYVALFSGGAFAVGSPRAGVTVGAAKWTREEAWADAARRVRRQMRRGW